MVCLCMSTVNFNTVTIYHQSSAQQNRVALSIGTTEHGLSLVCLFYYYFYSFDKKVMVDFLLSFRCTAAKNLLFPKEIQQNPTDKHKLGSVQELVPQ